jgi:hypothetical protein
MTKNGRPSQNNVRRRDRAWAWVFSAAAHAIVFAVVFWTGGKPPPKPVPPAPSMMVSLLDLPKPPGPPDPPAGEADDGQDIVQPPKPAVTAPVQFAVAPPAPDTSDLLSAAQLAGAASPGEGGSGGGGGGGCNMAQLVQQALRRDPLVRAAVMDANRLGKASMLWNGDWVQTGGQEGKGLSAVREAVAWEVAFAPAACRNQRMHGLVLLSLADGATRFAIGAGDWRWSELLGVVSARR